MVLPASMALVSRLAWSLRIGLPPVIFGSCRVTPLRYALSDSPGLYCRLLCLLRPQTALSVRSSVR
ncbi:hypothetical protein D3C71_1722020 [compost metagenome]